MNAVAPSGQTYRLRGQVAGRERRFLVDAAGTTVGSAADQDVVLTDDGVSRRHALLSIADGRLTVRDLGSKNGTRVDDLRVAAETTTPVEVGSTLGFGPVELVVEAIAPADTRLGLTLDPEPDRAFEPAIDPASTIGLPSGPAGRWLDLLDTLLVRRERGEASASSLLAEVAIGLGARGALITRGRRSPEVVAAWGDIRPIEVAWRQRSPAAETTVVVAPRADGVIVSSSLDEHGSCRTIGLQGPIEALAVVRPLLSILLRLLATHEVEPTTEPPSSSSTRELHFPTGHVVGRSTRIAALYRHLAAIADDDGPVLVVGETGVGKEYIARLVHDHSPRRDAPFVAVNCAALPADLLEAELFGIARGVATGVDARPGRFAEADGGSLLLDELGEMPPALQSKLLRVLERGEVQPLGGALRRLDVRVIGATNIDLEARIADGSFRADLYYRLALHVLDVPPLRARRDDIPLFIEHFLRDIARTSGRRPRGLTVAALDQLCAYPWPGNVRQLQHEVRRLIFACPEHEPIDSSLLSAAIRATGTPSLNDDAETDAAAGGGRLAEQIDALERRLIRDALDAADGVLARAADALGLHRNSLAHKMRRLAIDRPADTRRDG